MMLRIACALGLTVALLAVVETQQPQAYGAGVSLTQNTPLAHLLDHVAGSHAAPPRGTTHGAP